jgi:hypothetical protein
MESDAQHASETHAFLSHSTPRIRRGSVAAREDVEVGSSTGDPEATLKHDSTGERLPYNDYTTIDWMQELVRQQALAKTLG